MAFILGFYFYSVKKYNMIVYLILKGRKQEAKDIVKFIEYCVSNDKLPTTN